MSRPRIYWYSCIPSCDDAQQSLDTGEGGRGREEGKEGGREEERRRKEEREGGREEGRREGRRERRREGETIREGRAGKEERERKY